MYDIKRFSKGDPKSMTRGLLKEIIGEVPLSTMTAKTIPGDVLYAVEGMLLLFKYIESYVPYQILVTII